MRRKDLEKIADEIPAVKIDPDNPEWGPSPIHELDLSDHGYGTVFVKDEASEINPTRTMKDRLAWEIVKLYGKYARNMCMRFKRGDLSEDDLRKLSVPRFTTITSGNEGRALAHAFEKFGLPKPKLLIDVNGNGGMLVQVMRELHAEIIQVTLSDKPLSAKEINTLTGGKTDLNITSDFLSINPNEKFYDWLAHEIFNFKPTPNWIYVGKGSGRLMENLFTWQGKTVRNHESGMRDPRLNADASEIGRINIRAAEPQSGCTKADKLYAPFKPFALIRDTDIRAQKILGDTGPNSGIVELDEEYLQMAYEFLTTHSIETEPSGAAGLALYLQDFKKGYIKPKDCVVVVNTGKGIVLE